MIAALKNVKMSRKAQNEICHLKTAQLEEMSAFEVEEQ